MDLTPPLPPARGKAFDVVGLGEVSLDLVAVTSGWPAADTKVPLDAFEMLPGGQTATAVVACARLGWRTRYVGVIGADEFGERVTAALASEGVELGVVRRQDARSRFAVVLVDKTTGQRTILEHRDPRLALGDDEVAVAEFTAGRILLVDASDLPAAIRAARAARASGVPTIIDVERPAPGLDQLLSEVDVIIAAGSFPAAYTRAASVEDGVRHLEERFHPAVVVVTLGERGSFARCHGRDVRTPGHPATVVDTTGAGDAFRGGFAAGWLALGTGAPVESVLAYANRVAALNCRAVGAQTGLPRQAELAGGV